MKKIVICDIDGTISKIGDRVKYLKQVPKNWDSFYNDDFDDEPIKETCGLVRRIFPTYDIVFCTGRREKCRKKTSEWLEKNICLFADKVPLLMRKTGDLRSDTIVKPELIHEAGINFDDIAFVLEDRSCMVKKYRELGLTVFQVDEGEF
jgi:hypothetical protein